ncbi:Fic/DOC family protein [Microbacterium sp. CR_7]|uniref:Fic/DOC family protein n=1 Tax=Microbacterium sp. CR_7 TaxID=3055792 RepID=UPI0035C09A1B
MSAEFVDPYVYTGTSVLRNKLGLLDPALLSASEHRYVTLRQVQLERRPVVSTFDLQHLRAIHRTLFQDLYEWAGELRTVNISKNGDSFHHAAQMHSASEYTFGWLRESGLATTEVLTNPEFVSRSAEFLARLNYMHPFREGNGRTQRAFLNDVASLKGRAFDWRSVTPEENTAASKASHESGTGEPFISLFTRIVRPAAGDNTGPARARRRSTAVMTAPLGAPKRTAERCGAPTTNGTWCRRRGACPFHQ